MNSSQDHCFAVPCPQNALPSDSAGLAALLPFAAAQMSHCSERHFLAVSDLFILLYSSHVDLLLPGALCGYLLMSIFPTLKSKLSVSRDLTVWVLLNAIVRTVPGNITEIFVK